MLISSELLPIMRNIWRAGQAFLRRKLVPENSHANVKVWQVKQQTKLISGERFCKTECCLIGWAAVQVHLDFFFNLVYLDMQWLRYQVAFRLLTEKVDCFKNTAEISRKMSIANLRFLQERTSLYSF